MTERTSFETDIRPLFTERDIKAMIKAFNLASYDEVKAHSFAVASAIFLILELNQPFSGLFRVPAASLEETIVALSKPPS